MTDLDAAKRLALELIEKVEDETNTFKILARCYLSALSELDAARKVVEAARAIMPDVVFFMPAFPANEKLRHLSDRGAKLEQALTAYRTRKEVDRGGS